MSPITDSAARVPYSGFRPMPDSRTHVNPWIVTIAVMLATFMEVLDTTVVNVSIPHMAGNMGATVRRRHVGRHLVPGVERHHPAHGGMAGHRASDAAAC